MMWVLCEEDYRMLKKYLHYWSKNKQDWIRNKRKQGKIYANITKNFQ